MHECFTISCVKLYHLQNFTPYSKANACYRHFILDFIPRAYKKTKHLPIDSIIHSHNSVIWILLKLNGWYLRNACLLLYPMQQKASTDNYMIRFITGKARQNGKLTHFNKIAALCKLFARKCTKYATWRKIKVIIHEPCDEQIFMEHKLRSVLVLGRLVVLKKNWAD